MSHKATKKLIQKAEELQKSKPAPIKVKSKQVEMDYVKTEKGTIGRPKKGGSGKTLNMNGAPGFNHFAHPRS